MKGKKANGSWEGGQGRTLGEERERAKDTDRHRGNKSRNVTEENSIHSFTNPDKMISLTSFETNALSHLALFLEHI